MSYFHKCKTETYLECDPTQEYEYYEKYDELKQEAQYIERTRLPFINKENIRMKTQTAPSFEVPMKRNIFGLFTIPVTIYGKTYCFILDTGAQISAIKQTVMEDLQLSQIENMVEIGSAGGQKKTMHGCLLTSLQIGESTFENVPMLCLCKKEFSLRLGAIDCFRFDGIIGWDILQTFDFELDDIAKKFKVLKNIYRFSYQNFISDVFPVMFVKDEKGHILTFGFDSGSKRSWINKKSAEKYDYTCIMHTDAHIFGVHGMEKTKLYIYDKVILYLFKAKITISKIMSGNCAVYGDKEVDGVLGNEILKNRRMRFLNSKGMVLLL
ncbi:MAG: retroviral-like aspartic protease family protein [Erysipelotrichaceae bacterium]|nr:retroviral-like aspartic protease family protein [Erysipelotrichaceae bacterium]